ncbi:MAG: deoxyribose-phosphate aldolase [Actinomycetota bacterium]
MNHERIAGIVRSLDLTSLEETDTEERIAALCARAAEPGEGLPPVAAVCVYPHFVPLAKRELGAGDVLVATVSAFPDGLTSAKKRAEEIGKAIAAGADEIDAVLAPDALEDPRRAAAEIEASKAACEGRTVKVILETGRLGSSERITEAARLSMGAGADFIKTSTGKFEIGATTPAARTVMEAVRAFRDETGRAVGVKVAGGVRTAGQAEDYLELVAQILGVDWAKPALFRIGASSLLDDLVRSADSH